MEQWEEKLESLIDIIMNVGVAPPNHKLMLQNGDSGKGRKTGVAERLS